MKYKILKESKYSPKGYDVKVLNVGDIVELPESISIPFCKKGICEEVRPVIKAPEAPKKEDVKEEAPAEEAKAKKKKSKSKQA